jgi:hypothetical protein
MNARVLIAGGGYHGAVPPGTRIADERPRLPDPPCPSERLAAFAQTTSSNADQRTPTQGISSSARPSGTQSGFLTQGCARNRCASRSPAPRTGYRRHFSPTRCREAAGTVRGSSQTSFPFSFPWGVESDERLRSPACTGVGKSEMLTCRRSRQVAPVMFAAASAFSHSSRKGGSS